MLVINNNIKKSVGQITLMSKLSDKGTANHVFSQFQLRVIKQNGEARLSGNSKLVYLQTSRSLTSRVLNFLSLPLAEN